jgi:hypothetical protein
MLFMSLTDEQILPKNLFPNGVICNWKAANFSEG